MRCASLTTRDAVSGRNPPVPVAGYGGARPPAALALLDVAGAMPAARRLASVPAALVTRPAVLLQRPSRAWCESYRRRTSRGLTPKARPRGFFPAGAPIDLRERLYLPGQGGP